MDGKTDRQEHLKLKDKVDGMEMDLSMSNLSLVPVKQMATFSKVTRIDLSSNALSSLPDDFCVALCRLVYLDLSRNKLVTLPDNIHLMNKLQHLDLYKNRIYALPVNICHLRNLKWLDLKDNPLEDKLSVAAGPCLDEKQCRHCATCVLAYMKQVQSERERQWQQKLKEEKEKENERRKTEEELIRRQKLEKKIQKEQRRLQYLEQQRLVELEQENEKLRRELGTKRGSGQRISDYSDDEADPEVTAQTATKQSLTAFVQLMVRAFAITMFLMTVLIAIHLVCENFPKKTFCVRLREVPLFRNIDLRIGQSLEWIVHLFVDDSQSAPKY